MAARTGLCGIDQAINHVHWATTRPASPPGIMALAIDHRIQLEAVAREVGAPFERISDFKVLAVQAAARVADGRPGFGMFIDGRYGREALFRAADHKLWVARPVELTGSRPLDFEYGGSLGTHLIEWPTSQVIKCLCFYHPDDPEELRLRQERELARVYDACRTLGRDLLIEIIAGKHGTLADDTIPRVIQRIYDIGIKPDWWKLEPQKSATAWGAINEAVARNDSYCRGVHGARSGSALRRSRRIIRGLCRAFRWSRASPSAAPSISILPARGWRAGSRMPRRSIRWRSVSPASSLPGPTPAAPKRRDGPLSAPLIRHPRACPGDLPVAAPPRRRGARRGRPAQRVRGRRITR